MGDTREGLLRSIADRIQDYREGEIDRPTPQHVERWVCQFDDAHQDCILQEMAHVLGKTYFAKRKVLAVLEELVADPCVVGDDPKSFWAGTKPLRIQGGGDSQKSMLDLLDPILRERLGFGLDDCGADADRCLYLDDVLYSGNRLLADLTTWVQSDAPRESKVVVVLIAGHSQGVRYAKQRILKAAEASEKTVDLEFHGALCMENRRSASKRADVLWPAALPDDPAVNGYVELLKGKSYPPDLRRPCSSICSPIFSSEAGRHALEQQYLKYGARILASRTHLNKYMRPLGNWVLDTLGFGSLIVTYRNCPNTCPLALWVDEDWYPLFLRKTNAETQYEQFAKENPALLGDNGVGPAR